MANRWGIAGLTTRVGTENEPLVAWSTTIVWRLGICRSNLAKGEGAGAGATRGSASVGETWSAVGGAVGGSGWAGGQVHWLGLYLGVIGVWISE